MEKPGALGICLDELAGRVLSVEAHAHELLLGVTVAGERAGALRFARAQMR